MLKIRGGANYASMYGITYKQGDFLEFLCYELEVCLLVCFEYRELINISSVIFIVAPCIL